jgi:hypothetical protein
VCALLDEDDGVFWMAIEDVVENFSDAYICKVDD